MTQHKPIQPITLDALPLSELSQWLADNMLPDARTFLLPGTVAAAAGDVSGLGRASSDLQGAPGGAGGFSGSFPAGYGFVALMALPIAVKNDGADVLVHWTFSCYTDAGPGGAVAGAIQVDDDAPITPIGGFYFNEANSHRQISFDGLVPLPAGEHTITVGCIPTAFHVIFDNSDGGTATAIELP